MKGSPGGDWDQFLYGRGSEEGQVDLVSSTFLDLDLPLLQVVIGEEDDGLYVHVFPYTEEGGWDFEACKETPTAEEPTSTEEPDETCISESGVGDADARFELTGLKAGDKVYFFTYQPKSRQLDCAVAQ